MITIGISILAAAFCTGPWSPKLPPWPDVDRRSPALKAKLAKQKEERHRAAQKSRKDFDRAMEILKSPPEFCTCNSNIGRVGRVR